MGSKLSYILSCPRFAILAFTSLIIHYIVGDLTSAVIKYSLLPCPTWWACNHTLRKLRRVSQQRRSGHFCAPFWSGISPKFPCMEIHATGTTWDRMSQTLQQMSVSCWQIVVESYNIELSLTGVGLLCVVQWRQRPVLAFWSMSICLSLHSIHVQFIHV